MSNAYFILPFSPFLQDHLSPRGEGFVGWGEGRHHIFTRFSSSVNLVSFRLVGKIAKNNVCTYTFLNGRIHEEKRRNGRKIRASGQNLTSDGNMSAQLFLVEAL